MGLSVGADDAAFEGQLLAPVDVSPARQGWFRLGEFPCDAPNPCDLNEDAEAGPEAGRADQMGHSLDVSQNVYTQSPVESRLGMVNELEKSLLMS